MSTKDRHKSKKRPRSSKGKKHSWARKVRKALKCLCIALCTVAVLGIAVYFLLPNVFYSIYHHVAGTYRPDSSDRYDGIDVSHHNGIINWEKVAADKNIKFAYIKATEGYRHPDKRYAYNIKNARKAGIKAGSYHLLTTRTSMATQFNYFASTIDIDAQDIIPMVDIEEDKVRAWSDRQLQDSLAKFLRLAEDHFGSAPVIYCSYKFYKHRLAPHFDKNILFLARYSKDAPLLNSSDKYHDIWQFTEHGQIAGISNDVDLDRFGPNTSLNDILF